MAAVIAVIGAVPVAPALAQDLRPESLTLHGGTYSPRCAEASAPRVEIAASGLVVSQGPRRLHTPVRMDSYTSFGSAPTSPIPEGYVVEFIGDDFSLYVFQDGRGMYVPLDGYVPQAEAVVGKAGMAARFGRCAQPRGR
ncbi:hypothetical protein [Montanilutibacter psychrotolerans]|uniref:Uncharacterized protein n=1 Tax=Montanilutibacter psychrotolerans TaxID=1327343 RepID=A0A3M8SPA1_9GAMM|nr:hypothetical protein [Lysobacter psychrotolerans]RNF83089.1 hypothetical protein EER27_11255 [Lysobacter psychrotolerans]